MNQSLINAIEQKITGSKARACMASGMWIIEVVARSFSEATRKQFYKDIVDCVSTISPGENIWKVFVYSTGEERFSIEATLHTIPRRYGEDGVATITLAANDCYLLITDFDSEILQMDRPRPYHILGIEYKNSAGQKIMPLQPNTVVTYQCIEFKGMMFSLDGAKIQQDASSGVIDIEI